MFPLLDDYDWQEVFKYADGSTFVCGHDHGLPTTVESLGAKTTGPFDREYVAEIIAYSLGENDGPDWLMVGRLNDGRFFFISAGCDYTGWG